MNKDLKEIKIWNVKYNLLTISEIVDIVNEWLDEGRKGIHRRKRDNDKSPVDRALRKRRRPRCQRKKTR